MAAVGRKRTQLMLEYISRHEYIYALFDISQIQPQFAAKQAVNLINYNSDEPRNHLCLDCLHRRHIITHLGSLYFLYNKFLQSNKEIIDRLIIRTVIIKLRKRFYSTLREISFIVNSLRALEGELQAKKIGQIVMRDGGSGEKRLNMIQYQVLKEHNILASDFQHSSTQYCHEDIQIQMLLRVLQTDIEMALEGVVNNYNGPIPNLQPGNVLAIYSQIIKRRMRIIEQKCEGELSNEECLKLEAQIEEYLEMEGISHEKQPNQKIFMSILEHHYRESFEFKIQFEQLETEMEILIIELENKHIINKEKQLRNRKEGQGLLLIGDQNNEVLLRQRADINYQ